MIETTFEVQIPAALLWFGMDQDEIRRRVTEWLVLSLFTEEHISSGKAARLLGISRAEFLVLLRTRGISYVDYTADELAEEFASVQAFYCTSNSPSRPRVESVPIQTLEAPG